MSSGCLISPPTRPILCDSHWNLKITFESISVSNKVTITSVSDWTISKGWSRIFLLLLFFWGKERAALASHGFHSLGHVNYREGLFILRHLQPLQHFCFVYESYENKNLPSGAVSHLISLCVWSADRTCWYHNKIHSRFKQESGCRETEQGMFAHEVNRKEQMREIQTWGLAGIHGVKSV